MDGQSKHNDLLYRAVVVAVGVATVMLAAYVIFTLHLPS